MREDGNGTTALNQFEDLLSDFYNRTKCGDLTKMSNSASTFFTSNGTNAHEISKAIESFTVEGVTLTLTKSEDGNTKTLSLDVDGNTIELTESNEVDEALQLFNTKDEEECGLNGYRGGIKGGG